MRMALAESSEIAMLGPERKSCMAAALERVDRNLEEDFRGGMSPEVLR